MKHKLNAVFVAFMLTLFMAACGSEVSNTVLPPTEAVEATATPTPEPTATEIPTPEPTVTPTKVSKIKDSYEYGVITELGYASEWCNLRFTTQPGLEFGTQEGLEMYAECVDGARLEIRTELLPEEYLEISESDYLGLLVDELLDGAGNFSEPVLNTLTNADRYTVGSVWLEDADGLAWDYDFFIRKKESRMIVVTLRVPAVARGVYKSAGNLINCLNRYDSSPIYLPEEQWAHTAFEAGTFTENGYENEWLNLRFTLPDATLTEIDSHFIDMIVAEIEWETRFPYVQFVVEFANDMPAEEYLADLIEYYKTGWEEEYGYVFSVDEQVKTELLGGQDYKVMTAILSRPERADRYEEYYCRVQDNYVVCFQVLYEADSEEKAKEVMNCFTTY